MAKRDAKKAAKNSMLSGFRHHSHSMEQTDLNQFLLGQRDAGVLYRLSLNTYADVLAPDRVRAKKNALISLVTVVSRAAIDLGVDTEQSFSLSDYYIYTIETKTTDQELESLAAEIYENYAELVQTQKHQAFSLPVTRAIRYISERLYEPCRVRETAAYVHLNPQYFSSLFKQEVGVSPSRYIRNKKLEEAANLLMQVEYSVSDVSEALGFCNVSYFAQEFKKLYGVTPKQFTKSRKIS